MKSHFLVFSSFFLFAAPALAQVACTMEAKQCPDGSYVSRTGPNCEFSPCPGQGGNGADKDKKDEKKSENKGKKRWWKNELLNRDILQGTDDRTAGGGSGSAPGSEGAAPPAPPPPEVQTYINTPVQAPPRMFNNIAPRESQTYAPAAEVNDDSRSALDSWLLGLSGTENGQIEAFSNGVVDDLFPGYHFYTMRFRTYPVARLVPDPLRPSNIFAVSDARVVTHIPDEAHLKSFFLNTLPRLPNETRQRDALRAWLVMMQELQQDSYFRFSQPDSIAITSSSSGWSVSGKVDVVQGGRGEISAILSFDPGGNFLSGETDSRLLPGARPL